MARVKSEYVKKNTDAIITAAQDQALKITKANIDGADCPPLCRVCQSVDEPFMHIASGCKHLAKEHYMIRHNLIVTHVHWKLCRKFETKVPKNWYEHIPFPYTVNQTGIETLLDVEIKTTTKLKHKRPDIVVKMPGEREWQLLDIAITQYHNVVSKESEKVNKYVDLASIIRTEHKVKNTLKAFNNFKNKQKCMK